MIADKRIFAPRVVPAETWDRLWQIGELRSKQKEGYRSSEYLDPYSHQLGIIGEWTFGRLVGLKAAEDITPGGDLGFDFPGADVKAAWRYRDPWLKVREEKVVDDIVFPLVAVDRDSRTVRYCGYADAALLRKYPVERLPLRSEFRTEITGKQRDSNLGPSSHVLKEKDLIRDLPPGFEFKLRTLQCSEGRSKEG